MDAKDLRIETALGAHTNDGSTKYAQSGTALQTNGNKSYHDIGSNSLAKVDVPTARPCAIIGPDRVVQPTNDVYLKKVPVEPWPYADNIYQHPSEYPLKPGDYPPPRNISPRQTFQENMQRIMVPPTYTSVKNNEERTLKNSKLMPPEAKYCDVPYTISPINNEPKIVKSSEGLVLNNNSTYTQPLPLQGWSGSGINVRPLRPYVTPELYQYSEYSNYPGPRPISMIRPHRNVHEDVPQVYQDRFYPEASIRFKPYPTAKERPHQLPQARYDYLANYSNTFHLHSPYSAQKYDIQKSMPPHPCPVYPSVPLKYLDRRMAVPTMERYQRSPNQQVTPPFCNQNIPPPYGSVSGNCLQNRAYPYSPDPSTKPMIQNKFYFDNHNARKYYPNTENMYINDITQQQIINNDVLYQSYPPLSIHSLSPHHMFRKENPMKGYEQGNHFKNIEYSANMNPLSRLPLQFSPQTISISPDSNTSNDTTQTLSNTQEDCGYVSQSSTASVKSTESGVNRISSDIYRRHYMRYDTLSRINKPGQKLDTKPSSKDKKGLDVRQFLQMWNEGDEGSDNKESSTQKDSNVSLNNNQANNFETDSNQEQLYVLGLIDVPNEDLSKYDHIQKISKLPENIKGYNNIELLNQYEKLVESPGMNHFTLTTKQKDLHVPVRNIPRQGMEVQPRPISPLDVESKISQSVIHKEVGCNFEIRPCSPQMLNVEVATPVHNVLGERLIEKVVNPIITKSPMIHRIEEPNNDTSSRNSPKVQSCKMINNQYPSPNINDSIKTNYCLQDLESNSGLCLASLPRLDNDIELNFPEINQQFINANKIEPVKTSLRDLPVLDTEISCDSNKTGNKMLNKPFISEHINPGSESDKEISKLSKYRKHKRSRSIVEPNESDVNSKQHISHRTDSVIIKNPENVRSQEEYLNIPLNNDIPTFCSDVHLHSDNAVNINSDRNFNESNGTSTDIGDTAIDFSLNKTDDRSNFIYSINNLSSPLQSGINTDKNIILNNGNTKQTGNKFLNINSPKQFEENSVSTEFDISQPISVILDNSNCSDTLNLNNNTITDKEYTNKQVNSEVVEDDVDFQPIHENSLFNKTLKTHSKPKEVVLDISSVGTSSTEDIIERNNLSISSHGAESAPMDMKSYNNIDIISSAQFNNNIENHALNNNLTKNTNHLKTSLHEPSNPNLIVENAIDQNPINKTNIEDNRSIVDESKNITKKLSTTEVTVENVTSNDAFKSLHVLDDIKMVMSNDAKKIQECINQKATDLSEIKIEMETDVPASEKENLIPINAKEEVSNFAEIERDHIVEFNIVCSGENPELQNLKKISDRNIRNNNNINDCIKKDENYYNNPNKECIVKDFKLSSMPIFESLNIPCEVVDIKNKLEIVNIENRSLIDNIVSMSENLNIENKPETVNIENKSKTANIENKSENDNIDNNSDIVNIETKSEIVIIKNETEIVNIKNETEIVNINNDSKVIDVENKSEIVNVDNDSDIVNIENKSEIVNIENKSEIVNIENKSEIVNINNHSKIVDIEHKSEIVNVDNNPDIVNIENKSEINIENKPEIVNIESDSESDILNTLISKEISTKESKDCAVFYHAKTEFFFKKELLSPRIQNLLVYNHGFCTALNKQTEKYKTNVTGGCIKNKNTGEVLDRTCYEVESVSKEIISERNNTDPQIHRIDYDTDNVEHNERQLKNVNENNNSETFVTENNVVAFFSAELGLAEEQMDEIENNNNIDNENYKENLSLTEQFSKSQCSSRGSRTLKRSLSESAATEYVCKNDYGKKYTHTSKRSKIDDSEILVDSHILTQNFTNYIQSNRRNSISTIYNDENVSFCIVIDNDCVLEEGNENCAKICYTEIPGDCVATICTEEENDVNSELTEVITCEETAQCEYGNEFILQNMENKTITETWVEDVACMETVFSDDIAEDIIISAPSSPKDLVSSGDESDNIDSIHNVNKNEHTNKLKYIYGHQMSDYNAKLVEKLYRTPQMDVNKTLINRESQLSDEYNRYYDDESLEKILSESNPIHDICSLPQNDSVSDTSSILPSNEDIYGSKKNLTELPEEETHSTVDLPKVVTTKETDKKKSNKSDYHVRSCESSSNNLITYRTEEEKLHYAISSSPEVSSTTSEDKGSAILLKIRSYKGTKISEINEMGSSFNQINPQKFTNYNSSTSRPLITKAAQKYIPPLKETIRDLKVKLHLPKQSLYKLQQLKKSKEEPKTNINRHKHYIKTLPHDHLKKTKPKPKFEDVLKSIDEIQFKMHKEKNKKAKQCIPKVIIKKNENGAHYASTQSKETFNPDLTGRKWQPWVFLEKSNFIDNMALKQKFKAIYNHRKKMYVLAESFRKYKSISNSKFVISHPKPSDNLPTGKLKYTFRLKHN